MGKRIIVLVMIAALIPAVVVAGKSRGKKGSGKMTVQVREVSVKASPNYMGPSAGKLTYGAEVNVVGKQGSWCQIDLPPGWIPESALTKYKVKVNPDQKFSGKGAKRDEVALAGK